MERPAVVQAKPWATASRRANFGFATIDNRGREIAVPRQGESLCSTVHCKSIFHTV